MMAVRTAYQHMQCCMHEALQNPKYTGFVTAEAIGVSLAQVEERMFQLVGTSHLNYTIFLEVDPIFARRLLITMFMAASQNIVRVRSFIVLHALPNVSAHTVHEIFLIFMIVIFLNAVLEDSSLAKISGRVQTSRQGMTLYKQLQLQPDQRSCMAERWRSWRRRRAALGHHLATALARFQATTPQQTSISRMLERCATLVATAGEGNTSVRTIDQDKTRLTRNGDSNWYPPNASGSDTFEKSSLPMWSRALARFSLKGDGPPGLLTARDMSALDNSTDLMGCGECIVPEAAVDAANMHSGTMRAVHDTAFSETLTGSMSINHGSATTAASESCAYQACEFSGCRGSRCGGLDAACTMHTTMHGMYNTWAPCMVCGAGRRALLLGESGEVAKAAYDALGSVLDVHTSDALMHHEFIGPFRELSEKQGTVMLASAIDLAIVKPDMVALWQTAAEEERRQELFGHITSLHI